MTNGRKWSASKNPLYRGDQANGVCVPNPGADKSIVRHILYLEGPGRETPYLSNTELLEIAERFAGSDGKIWQAFVADAKAFGVTHLSKSELISLLKGPGKGNAKWSSAFEVMRARQYVEQWSEHLLDFSQVEEPGVIIAKLYKKP
jgi:hypothetical protein